MSYAQMSVMARSQSLMQRITAAAAAEGEADPIAWTQANMWRCCAQPGWVDAWTYAEGNKTVNVNPDTGERSDVINDDMILSAVQAIRGV